MPYREGKRWRGCVMHAGRRYQKLFQSKKEALAWEYEKRKEMMSGTEKKETVITLFELCDRYLDYAERFHKRTYSQKRLVCRKIIAEWEPDREADSITPAMVLEYLDRQARERTICASNMDRKELMALWRWGAEFCGLKHNPIAMVKPRAYERIPQYTPPQEDVLKVLAVATREEGVFLDAYLQTGARKSEIFRWTWIEDVNFERREVRLGTRKTKDGSMEYEWIPMSDSLFKSLMWWWQNRPVKDSPYVFCRIGATDRGEPFTVRRNFLKRLCLRAGVKAFGYHALRRYVASVLADTHKVSAKTIQRILRHKNVSTTERYIQNINKDLQAIINLLSRENKTDLPLDLPQSKRDDV